MSDQYISRYGYVTEADIAKLREKVHPGDIIPEGIVEGVYPFFMTVKPFGTRGGKMDTILWTDYYRQTAGIRIGE